jgi:hypothetical protein
MLACCGDWRRSSNALANGKAILAAADTRKELFEEIDRRRIQKYVIGFVPNSDISYL